MPFRNTVLIVAAVATLGAVPGRASDTRLRIEVSPRISAAPGFLRVRAMVVPNGDNRALEIVADSSDYYRSSHVTLDGAKAPAVTDTMLKNLPGGEYEVSVALVDSQGLHTVARRNVTVVSPLSER